ncbi:glutathione S-transferase family protein [Celerinatantimonas sp. MCCC 1A17872]|uniref:glutathione S-transferase family protein n=1 Tax=Celerinatantimonas sp. MCCC 1A17872 TaxID=3177514 RepID=UPI0038C16123
MEFILYSSTDSDRSRCVEWALNYKNIDYQRIEIGPDERMSTYLRVNPFAYLPTLSVDGLYIKEPLAILECLEELFPSKPLFGQNVFDRACIRQICEYVVTTIQAPLQRSAIKMLRQEISEEQLTEYRRDWVYEGLVKLKSQLCNQSQFMVSHYFSLADIFLAVTYQQGRLFGVNALPFYERHLQWLYQTPDICASEPAKLAM